MNGLKNIFIVDDDLIYQFTICHKLKLLGFNDEVKTFSDGEGALNFIIENLNCLEHLPDLIFLDINMPIMNGFDFLEEFAKIKPKIDKAITIHMVSSSVDDVDIEKASNSPYVSSYIIKPFNMEQVQLIIQDHKKTEK